MAGWNPGPPSRKSGRSGLRAWSLGNDFILMLVEEVIMNVKIMAYIGYGIPYSIL